MPLIDIERDPTKWQLIVFALLLVLFGGMVGGLVLVRPEVLLVVAITAAVAWVASMLWNKDEPRRTQLLGLVPPVVCGTAYAVVRDGAAEIVVAGLVWIAATAAATAVFASRDLGRRLYVGWLLAFLPLGWTVSHLLLAVVYYLVITPIGLVMRLAGRDPLQRKFDRTADTYWIQRKQPDNSKRYFQQF